jgi:acylphosphatase
MSVQAKQITVHGKVQGVGFRYFVQRAGKRLGLTGKVRNRPDDTVEIVVAGDAALITEFVSEVTKGPPLSRVERLDIKDIAPVEGFRSFQIEGW